MPINPSEIIENSPGKLTEIERGVFAFVPDNLPRGFALPSYIVKKLVEAENRI